MRAEGLEVSLTINPDEHLHVSSGASSPLCPSQSRPIPPRQAAAGQQVRLVRLHSAGRFPKGSLAGIDLSFDDLFSNSDDRRLRTGSAQDMGESVGLALGFWRRADIAVMAPS